MLVLLPYFITGIGLSIGLCSAAGYSGALLVVMAVVWFIVGFFGGLLLLVLLIGAVALFTDCSRPQAKPAPFYSGMVTYVMGLLTTLGRVRLHVSGLEKLPAGSEYDPNFYGGIDELIPNDMPETVNGIDYPDHGELWTLSLQYELTPDGIQLDGVLPLSELSYHREIHFNSEGTGIILNYRIGNLTNRRRDFLWKLHVQRLHILFQMNRIYCIK